MFRLALPVVLSGCALASGINDYTLGPLDEASGGHGASGGSEGGATAGGGGVSSGCAYVDEVLADSPVAYWRLGDDGAAAIDSVGDHDGTHIGTMRAQGLIACDDGAMLFGSDAAISLGDIFPFDERQAFTVEAWVDWRGNASRIVARDNGVAGWRLSITPTPQAEFGRYQGAMGDGDHHNITMGVHHLVGVYTGDAVCIFVDGAADSDGCDPSDFGLPLVMTPLMISPGIFEGVIDEVAIYDHPLTPERINAHYKAGR